MKKKLKKLSVLAIIILSLVKVCHADVIVSPVENLFDRGNFITLAITTGAVILVISLICWLIIRKR